MFIQSVKSVFVKYSCDHTRVNVVKAFLNRWKKKVTEVDIGMTACISSGINVKTFVYVTKLTDLSRDCERLTRAVHSCVLSTEDSY